DSAGRGGSAQGDCSVARCAPRNDSHLLAASPPHCEIFLGELMRRAIAVHTRGHWPEEAAVDSVTLAMIDRHRRRIRLVADSGAPFLLDLARAQHLAEGDGLELDNGNYLRVRAAPAPVIDITADTPADLSRI